MSSCDWRTSGQFAATTVSSAQAGATQMTGPILLAFFAIVRRSRRPSLYTIQIQYNTNFIYTVGNTKQYIISYE